MTGSAAVVVLAGMDAVATESAALALLLDLPGAVVVSYAHRLKDEEPVLRRRVTDQSGVLVDDTDELTRCCVSCTLRESVVQKVAMVSGTGRWRTIVLALPLTSDPAPIAGQLSSAIESGELDGVVLASVVALVGLETLEEDVFGDDLLVERDLALSLADGRSIGEAVTCQLEFADVVVGVGPAAPGVMAILQHLLAPTSQLHASWDDVGIAALVEHRHDPHRARRRTDPLQARASGAANADDVWTIELSSTRPLHPERLLADIEGLGAGRIRGRGHFWLPSRPDTVCVWDGSGGQLSIGRGGGWGSRTRSTRLVVTGLDTADRERIARAFADAVVTPTEMADLPSWAEREDGFEPWLG